MKIFYKTVKTQVPHCGVCKEMLVGNGSIAFPYSCGCGEWERDCEFPTEFILRREIKYHIKNK